MGIGLVGKSFFLATLGGLVNDPVKSTPLQSGAVDLYLS